MDNLTHALVGFVVAELATLARARRGENVEKWARPAYFTSALANNLPDLDFVYAGITQGKLGYLLHHRGHTHTLALAIPLALLALGLGLLWLRRTCPQATRSDRVWLAAVALAGPVLHVAMDGSNSYGVHPFWPVYDGWVYGDTVFIIEPLFWATTLPLLVLHVRWKVGRVVLVSWWLATLILPWLSGFVPPLAAAWATAITLAMALATWRFERSMRAVLALSSSLGVLVVLAVCSRLASAKSAKLLARQFPDARTHDLVMSPLPANPLCWGLLAIQTEREMVVARRSLVSLAPAWIAADRCFADRPSTTAKLVPVPAPSSPDIDHRGQFQAPRAELVALARDHCVFAGLLRFARAPYWMRDGERLIAGDLRYDRGSELGFAELELERVPARCPRFVPSWIPPRRDLFE
jgi:inner membrane protein